MNKKVCKLCPHHCALEENEIGICRARSNKQGNITAINYGHITSMALDPIEKKPLRRYFPGSYILSVGSFGCNLLCPFCQNYEISTVGIEKANTRIISPQELVEEAVSLRSKGNIGIAYTYNEPLVGYEYVKDCARAARQMDLKNVLVTNGCFCEEPIKELLPYIDTLNIDLKAFTETFYRKLGGDLDTVKRVIVLAAQHSHVEVTTLIIPGENDSEEEVRSLSSWLGSVRQDIPLHLTRFFPRYRMKEREPTDIAKLHALADIAREYLQYVYIGNC